MGMEIHYIPVGFDFERLVQPLYQDDFDADKVILFRSKKNSENEHEAKIAENIVNDLARSIESVLDIDAEIEIIPDIYDYVGTYEFAYQKISKELDGGNQVYVNISSMPRTVAFAFATAVDTLILETPDARDDLYTYYTSPKKYLVTEVREELDETVEFLREVDFPEGVEEKVTERLGSMTDTLQKLEKGTTSGTREIKDGKHHVEFVAPPIVELTDAEEELLHILAEHGEVESISELARLCSDNDDTTPNSSVQYQVDSLEEKGLIRRTEGQGSSHRVRLSRIGKMWVTTRL